MSNGSGADLNIDKGWLDESSDEELVDLFLTSAKADRNTSHLCFETIISRYHWLINHIVRNSHFRFPAWDSADDVISRVIFKVYRGLASWRKEGKLSSFIGRITTSELIDTIRRVGRDKSWDPRQLAEPDEDQPSVVETAPSKEPSPEEQVLRDQRLSLIDQLLTEVCRDWKDSVIVNEYIIGERNAKEICDKYQMSEDLVYQRARRLRVRLMKWLADRGINSAETLLISPPTGTRR
jgi:RNA polymerase sigma factor (sigma-70 family)